MHNLSHCPPPPPRGGAPAEQRSSHDPQQPLQTSPSSICSFVFLMSNWKPRRMKAISQSQSRHCSAKVHSGDVLLGAARAQQRPRVGSPDITREAQGPPPQRLERGHIVLWSRSLPVCPVRLPHPGHVPGVQTVVEGWGRAGGGVTVS